MPLFKGINNKHNTIDARRILIPNIQPAGQVVELYFSFLFNFRTFAPGTASTTTTTARIHVVRGLYHQFNPARPGSAACPSQQQQ